MADSAPIACVGMGVNCGLCLGEALVVLLCRRVTLIAGVAWRLSCIIFLNRNVYCWPRQQPFCMEPAPHGLIVAC